MNIAIIVAGGLSTRFDKARDKKNSSHLQDKLLCPVLGFPLIYYTISAFNDHPQIQKIIISASKNNKKEITEIVKKYRFPKVIKIITGGETRLQSVEKGFKAIVKAKPKDIVLIHNGANPLVIEKEITDCLSAIQKFGAAAVGKKVVDTIKEIKSGHIIKTHDRTKLAGMQTPQGAQYDLYKKALESAQNHLKQNPKVNFTDDASLIENLGLKVKLIPASEHNFKVTTPHDLEKVKHIMGETPVDFLVGFGQDSHSFLQSSASKINSKESLWLGGVNLKDHPKLLADSDGDVILHALYNAISQALGEGSLGRFATDLCKIKNIKDSKKYLLPLLAIMKKRHYSLNNIGIQLECARPKIDPISSQIKKSLSVITGLPEHRIGITATTGENLTEFGKGKGIQCFAIVSLKQNAN